MVCPSRPTDGRSVSKCRENGQISRLPPFGVPGVTVSHPRRQPVLPECGKSAKNPCHLGIHPGNPGLYKSTEVVSAYEGG